MPIFQGIDQLHIDYHFVSFSTDASFQNVGDPEQLANFPQVVNGGIAKLHHRRTANHAQFADLRQAGQNIVLNAIGKKCVLFVVAEICKRQDRDTFFRYQFAARAPKWKPPIDQDCDQEQ